MKLLRKYYKNFTAGDLILKEYVPELAGNSLKTLELPYLNNTPNVSCIPEGIYKIRLHISPKFGPCIAIISVPERSNILIHPGNSVASFTYMDGYEKAHTYKVESKGCILPGTELYKVTDTNFNSQALVFNSKKALDVLMKYIRKTQDTVIEITKAE